MPQRTQLGPHLCQWLWVIGLGWLAALPARPLSVHVDVARRRCAASALGELKRLLFCGCNLHPRCTLHAACCTPHAVRYRLQLAVAFLDVACHVARVALQQRACCTWCCLSHVNAVCCVPGYALHVRRCKLHAANTAMNCSACAALHAASCAVEVCCAVCCMLFVSQCRMRARVAGGGGGDLDFLRGLFDNHLVGRGFQLGLLRVYLLHENSYSTGGQDLAGSAAGNTVASQRSRTRSRRFRSTRSFFFEIGFWRNVACCFLAREFCAPFFARTCADGRQPVKSVETG